MTVKELRETLGMDAETFGQQYRIPLPVLAQWEDGSVETPAYVLFLLERVVMEDRKEILTEKAVEILYKHIGHKLAEAKMDKSLDFLQEKTDAQGRAYCWYKDDYANAAICIDDMKIIDDPEVISRLFARPEDDFFEQLEMESMLRMQSFL